MSQPAPVALFIYNRPDLTGRTLEALAENRLAEKTHIYVFADGARREEDKARVDQARAAVAAARGFADVTLIASQANRGLSRSILSGVSRVTAEHGRAIALEDDIVTSPHFLAYMNDALDRYAEDDRVAAISGYTPPFDEPMPETFFQRDAECWGWATWSRAWSLFNPDGLALLAELKRRRLLRFFDQDGTANYVDMLKRQIVGKNDSWAVRWRASVILADKLSLYPGQSLTQNIGFDGSGTHSDGDDIWRVDLNRAPVHVGDIEIRHSPDAFAAFMRFNRKQGLNSLSRRMTGRGRALLRRLKL